MLGIIGGAAGFVLVLGVFIARSRSRAQEAARNVERLPPPMAESVRVDLAALRSVPALASAVEGVKWSKLQKQAGGRTDVGGVLVFGPQRLTWAPDDRARGFGVGPWQLAWADVSGGTVRTATTTTSASLELTLVGGPVLELLGVKEAAALAALRRLSPADG